MAAADVDASGYNLDLRNPNRVGDLEHWPVAARVAELVRPDGEILAVMSSAPAYMASGV